jgi:hypothetical protein
LFEFQVLEFDRRYLFCARDNYRNSGSCHTPEKIFTGRFCDYHGIVFAGIFTPKLQVSHHQPAHGADFLFAIPETGV